MVRPYPFPATAGLEAPLSELLADPIMQTLLRYDRLTVKDVRRVIDNWHTAQLAPAA